MSHERPAPPASSGLFVRLPNDHARRLDRAAAALSARKKDLVAGLVDRYVDPDTPEGLAALRDIAGQRRVIVEEGRPAMQPGHHAFHPTTPREVLTVAEAAELLAVEADTILALAEQGELPGRKIGSEWRFARRGLLDWLARGTASP
jgi:excisionase family DNA binding protein